MGYARNHLATLATGVFAIVLTGLWPLFVDYAPIMNFIFIMAVPITWFLTFTCWISQKSADYMHNWHTESQGTQVQSTGSVQTIQTFASDQNQVNTTEIKEAKTELSEKLNQLQETVKIKDSEIERLNQEISSLETLVQIESLKTELANLKMLASKQKK